MIDVQWANNQRTAILWIIPSKWTTQEYEAANQKMLHMIEGQAQPISLILDMRNAGAVPQGVLSMMHRTYREQKHLIQAITIINHNGIWERTWKTLQLIYGRLDSLNFVNSPAEAFRVIN